jgi:hypothetical protein
MLLAASTLAPGERAVGVGTTTRLRDEAARSVEFAGELDAAGQAEPDRGRRLRSERAGAYSMERASTFPWEPGLRWDSQAGSEPPASVRVVCLLLQQISD